MPEATLAARRTWLIAGTVLAVVLAVVVTLPTLELGFMLDDYVMRARIENHLLHGAASANDALDLFNLSGGPAEVRARVRAGDFPWWTSKHLVLHFYRPLAVLTHYVDYAFVRDHAWLMHAHNIVWYALLVGLCSLLYARLLSPTAAALAGVLYAIDDAHVEGVGWIASRNTLMTATFVLATLLLHDRARRGKRLALGDTQASLEARARGSRFAAPLALAAALLSSEGGIAAWALLLPYELFVSREALRERVRALVPLALVTATWLVGYKIAGYGSRGGDVYIDPLAAPALFFTERLPLALPIILQELFGLPAMLWQRHLQVWPLGLALVGWAFVSLFFVSRAQWRALAPWLLACVLCVIPICAIGPTPRLLFVSSFPALGAVAQLVVGFFSGRGGGAHANETPRSRALACLLAAPYLIMHVPVALYEGMDKPRQLLALDDMVRSEARSFPSTPKLRGKVLVLLNTPNYFVSAMVAHYLPRSSLPARTLVLNSGLGRLVVERPEPNSIVLEPEHGFIADVFARTYRTIQEPFAVGERVGFHAFVARVEALMPDGRPRRVRFSRIPLEHESVVFGVVRQRGYELVALPAVGQRLVLEP